MNYHVVRSSDGFHLIAKSPPRLSETFVDIRAFSVADWTGHPQLASALVQANKQHLLGDSAAERHSAERQPAAARATAAVAGRCSPAQPTNSARLNALRQSLPTSSRCGSSAAVMAVTIPSTRRTATPHDPLESTARRGSMQRMGAAAIHPAAPSPPPSDCPPVNRRFHGPESQSILFHWLGGPVARTAGALRQRLRAESGSDASFSPSAPASRRPATSTFFAPRPGTPAAPRKVLQPPEWLSWCLISVGAVLCLHSLAMPKPG